MSATAAAITSLYDLEQLDAELSGGGNPLPVYRQALKDSDITLHERFNAGVSAEELVAQRTCLVDEILKRAWSRHFASVASQLALVAVGGYGRGELHPGSDIDLMILLPAEGSEAFTTALEAFLMFLWDIGLEVGHSVRTVADCEREAAQDITVATTLMEARLLEGAPALFKAMRERMSPAHIWPSAEFFAAKMKEQSARHHKYHDTAYKLEPNIKESPGGLRDIHTIGWVAKRHFGAERLSNLVDVGFLTRGEYQTLKEGQSFLWRIRIALHLLIGRREDRLLFDYQRDLAKQLGYRDEGHRLAVEHFMKQYYRTVMELSRLNEMLLQLFQEALMYADEDAEPVRINKRFQAHKGFLEVVDNKVFEYQPIALLELFLILQQHRELKGVRASTIRLIRDHRHLIDEDFRNDLGARSLFMEILRQPHGLTTVLRKMNNYGVLAAYIPAFESIVGQMQYDLFHIYTVDEHTLFLVRNLRRFTVKKFADEFPLCSQVVQTIPKLELLYLAGLFHDIAKGRGGDHSELGTVDAEAFCRRHDLSDFDTELVCWLVRNHLIMSTTAQRKDISDPEVINTFAKQVGNGMRLDYLYLLTVADVRATSPDLWNSWKDTLLIKLFSETKRALRRGLENPLEQAERIKEVKAAARAALQQQNLDDAGIDAVWQYFSDEYFLRRAPQQICIQTMAISAYDPACGPLIILEPEAGQGGTEVFIYTPDEDRLFALTTGLLDQLGLNVADASIITSTNGFTLNTYVVLDETGETVHDGFRADEILHALRKGLSDPQHKFGSINRRMPRQLKHFPLATRVSLSIDEANQRTAVELITSDRPGLLTRVGQAFIRCQVRLQNARIATLGARTEDVFYVTDIHNRPLTDEAQIKCLKDTLVEYLDN